MNKIKSWSQDIYQTCRFAISIETIALTRSLQSVQKHAKVLESHLLISSEFKAWYNSLNFDDVIKNKKNDNLKLTSWSRSPETRWRGRRKYEILAWMIWQRNNCFDRGRRRRRILGSTFITSSHIILCISIFILRVFFYNIYITYRISCPWVAIWNQPSSTFINIRTATFWCIICAISKTTILKLLPQKNKNSKLIM